MRPSLRQSRMFGGDSSAPEDSSSGGEDGPDIEDGYPFSLSSSTSSSMRPSAAAFAARRSTAPSSPPPPPPRQGVRVQTGFTPYPTAAERLRAEASAAQAAREDEDDEGGISFASAARASITREQAEQREALQLQVPGPKVMFPRCLPDREAWWVPSRMQEEMMFASQQRCSSPHGARLGNLSVRFNRADALRQELVFLTSLLRTCALTRLASWKVPRRWLMHQATVACGLAFRLDWFTF